MISGSLAYVCIHAEACRVVIAGHHVERTDEQDLLVPRRCERVCAADRRRA